MKENVGTGSQPQDEEMTADKDGESKLYEL